MRRNQSTIRHWIGIAHPLLLVAGLALVGAVWLLVAPETFPFSIGWAAELTDEEAATGLGIVVGLIILSFAGVRLLRRSTGSLDRSPITPIPPERGTLPSRAETTNRDGAGEKIGSRFDTPGDAERRVAMYGRRALDAEWQPAETTHWFEQLAGLAQETYAITHGCPEAEAARAIDDGTWTDDREVAAFLATVDGDAPTYTTFERLRAWLLPRRTVERRVNRTLAEIDSLASDYLTYEPLEGESDAN